MDILSVAIDAQPDRAQFYLKEARAEFPTVIDTDNLLGELLGFKVVPNCLLVDEDGVICFEQFGGFDIRDTRAFRMVNEWMMGLPAVGDIDIPRRRLSKSDAIGYFREGLKLFHRGQIAHALIPWGRAVQLDPDNYVIRKQIWAFTNPDRFYDGPVDYDWQRKQIALGL